MIGKVVFVNHMKKNKEPINPQKYSFKFAEIQYLTDI